MESTPIIGFGREVYGAPVGKDHADVDTGYGHGQVEVDERV